MSHESDPYSLGQAPDLQAESLRVPTVLPPNHEVLPEEPLLSEQFVSSRFEGLKQSWSKAKDIGRTIADRHLYVEHEGYRLGMGDSMKARLYRLALIANGQSMADATNPRVRQAHNARFHETLSTADIIKMGAWELATVAPVRTLGLMAMHGAASAVEHYGTPGKASTTVAAELKSVLGRQLDRIDNRQDNPVARRKAQAATVKKLISSDFYYLGNERAAWEQARNESKPPKYVGKHRPVKR